MSISLKRAGREDMKVIREMQIRAFDELLTKYQDYDTNPATESFERVMQKFEQP